MNEATDDATCQPLIGCSIQSLVKRDWDWFLVFADGLSVATESPWRFVIGGSIFVTSEDHGHLFGLPAPVDAAERVLSQTAGQTVIAAAIHPVTGDLALEFSNGALLQFLQLSCGYEAWRLCIRGMQTICIGGGSTAQL